MKGKLKKITLQQWRQWNTSHSHFYSLSGYCSTLFNIYTDPNPPLLPPPSPPPPAAALSPSVCLQHTELLTPVNCLPPTPQSSVPSWSVSMEIPSQVVRRHWHNHGNNCQWGWEKLVSNLQKREREEDWRRRRRGVKGMKKNERAEQTLHFCTFKQNRRLKSPLCSRLTLF